MRSTCKKVLTFTPRTREGKKGGAKKIPRSIPPTFPSPKACGRGERCQASRIPPLPPHLQTLPAGPLRPPVLLPGPEVRPPAASRLPDESGFPRDVPLTLPCRLSVVVCSRWNGKASRAATAAQLSAGVCVPQGTLGRPCCMPGALQGRRGSSWTLGVRPVFSHFSLSSAWRQIFKRFRGLGFVRV